MNQLHLSPPRISSPTMPFLKWAPILASVVLIFSSGTAVLADSAKPGDVLYPVDIWVESLSENLVRDDSAKAKLFASIGDERVSELEALSKIDISKLSAPNRQRLEKARQQALENTTDSLVALNTVEEIVQKLYDESDNEETRDSMLRLNKHLQQVEDRRLERLKKLSEWEKWDDHKQEGDRSRNDNKARDRVRKIFKQAFEDSTPEEEDFSPNPASDRQDSGSGQSGDSGQGSGRDKSNTQQDQTGSSSGSDDEESEEDSDNS